MALAVLFFTSSAQAGDYSRAMMIRMYCERAAENAEINYELRKRGQSYAEQKEDALSSNVPEISMMMVDVAWGRLAFDGESVRKLGWAACMDKFSDR